VIPCPRLPVFLPAFLGSARQVLSGTILIEGADPGLMAGVRGVSRDGSTALVRGDGDGVGGEIVWIDGSKYDEAIMILDARFEPDSKRVLCRVVDERAGCEVDCWGYLGGEGSQRGA